MVVNYLLSAAFQLRYVLAAHFVRDCAHVIEIGGYQTPITWFLTGRHDSVTVYDERIAKFQADRLNGHVCDVRHVRALFQDIPSLSMSKFGLVVLDMDIAGDLAPFYAMVRGSEVAVLEFAIDHDPSKQLFENTMARCGKAIDLQLELDLSKNDFGNQKRGQHTHPKRRMVVLR